MTKDEIGREDVGLGSDDLARITVMLRAHAETLKESHNSGCGCAWRAMEAAYVQSPLASQWLTAPRDNDGGSPTRTFVTAEVQAMQRSIDALLGWLNAVDDKPRARALNRLLRDKQRGGL